VRDITARKQAEIEIARLLESEREQRRLAESLRDTAVKINSTLDFDQALDHILDAVERVVPYEAVSLLLLDRAAGVVRLARYRGVGERKPAPSGLARPIPAVKLPALRQIVETREPLVVPDARLFPGWADVAGLGWVRSFVSVPIWNQGELIGCLNLWSARPGFFGPAHLRGLQAFAVQAALALGRAQLFQAEQRRRREAVALQQVTQAAMMAHMDMEALLEAVVLTLAQIAGYPLIRVYLTWDEAPQLVAQHGYRPQSLTPSLPPSQRLIERVLRTSQPVFVPDIQAEPDYYPTAMGVHSLIALPLTPGGQLAGALVVETRADQALERHDFEWLADVARSVSVALENARLYTDLQGLLEEREQTQAHLIQTEKMMALGRLAASFAHEINNPLQAVQGCLTLAREELRADLRRDKLDRYLDVAEAEMARVAALVRRMRDFYRPQPAVRHPTDVHAVLESVLELTANPLQHGGIAVEREWASDLPEVTANPDELKQVFLNLVLNAVDGMPRGGKLSIRTTLDHRPASGTTRLSTTALRLRPLGVRIEFADTGQGMPPETLARLFEPFFTSKEQGSGLGLYISYNILHHHGAQITATSDVGQGATFTIWLPVNLSAVERP